jgi:hypothetical protein
MKTLVAAVLLAAGVAPALAHPCDADAKKRALALLNLHTEAAPGGQATIGDVKPLGDIRALRGKGRFDVLETAGYVYKAEYRIRLIYAKIVGSCLLMGQEILEVSDPY